FLPGSTEWQERHWKKATGGGVGDGAAWLAAVGVATVSPLARASGSSFPLSPQAASPPARMRAVTSPANRRITQSPRYLLSPSIARWPGSKDSPIALDPMATTPPRSLFRAELGATLRLAA